MNLSKELKVKSDISPYFIKTIGEDLYLIWFHHTNTYTVINHNIHELLSAYLKHEIDGFIECFLRVNKNGNINSAKECYSEINNWLLKSTTINEVDGSNSTASTSLKSITQLTKRTESFCHCYDIRGVRFSICTNSKFVLDQIHPQLDIYSISQQPNSDINNIRVLVNDEKKIELYIDGAFIETFELNQFHVLLGKLSLKIMNIMYSKDDSDWLGVFHATTFKKDGEAIMCIGKSGSGKSTFSALLSAYGYDVIADDFTPMLAENHNVFRNPSAISIKEGAFTVIDKHFPDFDTLELRKNYKGFFKYLPNDFSAKKDFSFDCKTVISIKYDKNANDLNIEELSVSEGLEILISESWISDDPIHALQFADWIKEVKFYRLTYSVFNESLIQRFTNFSDVNSTV